MKAPRVGRRDFLKDLTGVGGDRARARRRRVLAGTRRNAGCGSRPRVRPRRRRRRRPAKIKFAVIGLNHGHINGQTTATIRGGGELVAVYAKEPDLARGSSPSGFRRPRSPAARARSSRTRRSSWSSAPAFPDERAPLGIRVMQHGKDYMVDKPGITTLEQLAEVRRVQAQTKRIYSIMYSERLENRATVRAGELVKAGAIGRVIQTIGLGPHRMNPKTRPAWFFERPRYGGILCDIGSHQGDQFLYFTGSTTADVVASQVGNVNNPQYPGLEDFGDVMVRGNGGTGYIRVDWFTPDGLADLGRRPADDPRHRRVHRDPQEHRHRRARRRQPPVPRRQKETRYIDCADVDAALRRAAGRRRPQSHRDGDAAGALLPGDRADAEGAEAGAAGHVQARDAADVLSSGSEPRVTSRRVRRRVGPGSDRV